MKIFLTGATGVLGSHIMYDFLEYFIDNKLDGKIFLVARDKGKVGARERINALLSSDYTPKALLEKGAENLFQYIEMVNADIENLEASVIKQLEGAYFIHSAGFVNLSTDLDQQDKIFHENTFHTKSIFDVVSPYIKKFIYISTAFSSGIRSGLVSNDFHNLEVPLAHRNAYEQAKFHTEEFIMTQCAKLNLPYQIIRPSVIGGKMLSDDNRYFIPKHMVFYLMAKFFHFTAQLRELQDHVRFIINKETGLNIIPVDYVSKVIVSIFQRTDVTQLNIVHNKSFNLERGIKLIMKEVGYANFSFLSNAKAFEYQNNIEKAFYESIGKHLTPYLISTPSEFDTTQLNSIKEIPALDDQSFTEMIRYAKVKNFKDINI
jgi:nucleoside-diphosphate-sugar epimerase